MIKLPQARELLAQAVATQGREFRYRDPGDGTQCSYRVAEKLDENDSRPCTKTECLIGVALRLAGETRQMDPAYNDLNINGVSRRIPGMLSNAAAQYFCLAQQFQDRGHDWGFCFNKAEEWAETVSGGIE